MQPLSLNDYMNTVLAARGFTIPFPGRRMIHGSSSVMGKRVSCPPKCPDRNWDTSSYLVNGYWDCFPGENGRGLKFMTHLHLVSRLNISGSTRSISLLHVYRENFTLTVSWMGLWGSIGTQVLTDTTDCWSQSQFNGSLIHQAASSALIIQSCNNSKTQVLWIWSCVNL
jgi:hypothetical protein